MGYGQSTAFAIVLIGVLVSLSILFPAVETTVGDVFGVYSDAQDISVQLENTEVSMNATNQSGQVVVELTNEGSTTIHFEDVTILVDDDYVDPDSTSVEGNTSRTYILPGETAEFQTGVSGNRTKVVLKYGISLTDTV